MMTRYRVLIGLLVLANFTIAGYMFARSPELADESVKVTTTETKKPEKLPSVRLQDDAGKEVATDDFAGKSLFVQFINPKIQAQVDSYLRARTAQYQRPVSWLLISKGEASELREQLPSGNRDIIVDSEYERWRALFGVPKCCEEWLLYDSTGSLRASGKYDRDDIVSSLKNVVDGRLPFSTGILLEELKVMNEQGLLRQLHAKAAQSKSGKAITVLFSSACTGCPEDYLIRIMSARAIEDSEIGFLALLPNTFSQSDIDRFKTNLEIPFRVEAARAGLSHEWLQMNEKYGASSINGSIIAVSRGKIISVVNGLNETNQLLEDLARNQ